MNTAAPEDSGNRFELLVQSVTDYAIYMLSTNGTIVSWNAGARRFKGYEAEEIVGQHFSRFVILDDDQQPVILHWATPLRRRLY